MRVYLAGAMGCYQGQTMNYGRVWRELATQLFSNTDCDIEVINPTLFYNYDENYHKTEKEIMKYELRLVSKVDVVLVNLRDLEKSLGTSDEILTAYMNNIPIVGFYDEDDLNIHPWKIEQIDRIETGEQAIFDAVDYIVNYY